MNAHHQRPRLTLIAIVAADGAIGRAGDQPFHIPADFRHFKAATMGKPIVMGRRTFEALPKGALPGRRNIVITSDADWTAPGAERAASLDGALAMCAGVEEVMVIGGGRLYRSAIGIADRLMLTEVDATVADADVFFPAVDPTQWELVEASPWTAAADDIPAYRFAVYHSI